MLNNIILEYLREYWSTYIHVFREICVNFDYRTRSTYNTIMLFTPAAEKKFTIWRTYMSTTDLQSQRAVWFVPLKTVSYVTWLLLYIILLRFSTVVVCSGRRRAVSHGWSDFDERHTHTYNNNMFCTITII